MAGDGVFATFDGPARGILCAREILAAAATLGLELRVGLHTGECEVLGEKVAGIAVHVGARVAAAAGAGEVLVSSTVKDLVAGSGLQFEDRGDHELKGIPEPRRLFAVVD
jgi:class 3 adenylate cyclase